MTSLLFVSHNTVHPAPSAPLLPPSDGTPTRERVSSPLTSASATPTKRGPLSTATTQVLHTRQLSRHASPLVVVRKVPAADDEKQSVDDDDGTQPKLPLGAVPASDAFILPNTARVKLPSLTGRSSRASDVVQLPHNDSRESSSRGDQRGSDLLLPPEGSGESPSPSSSQRAALLPNQADDTISLVPAAALTASSSSYSPDPSPPALPASASSTSSVAAPSLTAVATPSFVSSTFSATAPLPLSATGPPSNAASFSSSTSSVDSARSPSPPTLAPSDSASSLPLVKPGEHRTSLYTSSLRRVSLTTEHDAEEGGIAPLIISPSGGMGGSSRTSTSFSMSPHSPTGPAIEHRSVTPWQLLHHALEGSLAYKCLLTACILYVFFADDIKLLCTYSPAGDSGVLAGYALCIAVLLCDIAVRAASSPNVYFLSPLFFFELAGSVLVLLYLPPLYPASVSRLWLSSDAGRAVALGGALPIMCRLIGVWMLDNWVKKAYRVYETLWQDSTEREEEKEEREEGKRIRTQLAQHTSITVVSGAICMLLLAAFLEYSVTENAPYETAQLLDQQLQAGQGGAQQFASYWGSTLLYLQYNATTVVDQRADRLPGLRSEQLVNYTSAAAASAHAPTSLSVLFYDSTLATNAAWNLYRTLFVLVAILVTFAFAAFGSHSVIVPLERAVQAVNNLIADPLADLVRMNGKRTSATAHSHRAGSAKASSSKPLTETQLVSSTLLKLARLLQVGFGDAGAEIIAKNLHGDLSFLDPMIPGRKIYGIFGFCSLSHFELCTEVLEEEVMVFVNQVAEIIHGVCHRHGGQVNRSLGPSFLLVWKLRMDREGRVAAGGAAGAAGGANGAEQSVAGNVSVANHHRTHTTMLRTRRGSNSQSASVHPSPVSPPHERPGHRSAYSITRTSMRSGWSLFEGRRGRMGKIDEQEERERNKERERAKRRGVKVGAKPAASIAVAKDDEAAAAERGPADHVRSVSFDPQSLYSPYSQRDDMHSPLPGAEADEEEKEDDARTHDKARRQLMRGVYGGQSLVSSLAAESATDALMEGDEEDELERKDGESDFHRQQTGATDAPVDSVRAMSFTPSGSTDSLPLTPSTAPSLSPQQSAYKLDEPLLHPPAVAKPSKRRHSLHANDTNAVNEAGEAKADEQKEAAPGAALLGDDKQQRLRNQFRRHSLPPRKSDEDTRKAAAAAAASSNDDDKEHAGAKRPPLAAMSSRTREGSRPQPILIPSSSFVTRLHPASPPPAPSSLAASHLTPNSSALPISSLPSAMRVGGASPNPLHNNGNAHKREFSHTSSITLPHGSTTQLLGAPPQPHGSGGASPHQRSMSAMQPFARGGLQQPVSASRRTSYMPVHRASTLSLSKLSDQALIAFLHTTMSILTAPSLNRWRKHKAMVSRLSSFSVNVSFGLHVGWAIEGAIGSVCKIDASYLSPHVNSSSRLMMACKQYHCSLLMSEQFYLLLHPAIRTRCRHIDRVLLKGVADPMNVYTFDIAVKDKEMKSKVIKSFIEDDDGESERQEKAQGGKVTRYLYSLLSLFKSSAAASAASASASSSSHSDDVVNSRLFSALSALQSGLPVNFIPIYNRAVSSYLDGDWAAAKEALYSVMEMWPDDESAMSLFRFMENEQREWKENQKRKAGEEDDTSGSAPESGKERAPGDWKGYRELKKK